MKRLALLGASGHGKVVAEIAEMTGWHEVVFFDDAFPRLTRLEHWQVIGTTNDLLAKYQAFTATLVTIGNNGTRHKKSRLLQEHGLPLTSLIHPSATVSRYATLGSGSVVMAGAVINPFASIGLAAIINTGAIVEHDCILGDGVHISPNAALAGNVTVGTESWIGIGAAVRQGITIGNQTTIGAGAVVVTPMPDLVVAAGVPARIIRSTTR